MISINSNTIDAIYVGDNKIKEVYLGNTLIYKILKFETLIVNVSASDNTSVDGQVVTVNYNSTNYTQTVNQGKVQFVIPEGVTYKVSISSMGGFYETPATKTYTAGSATRTVSMQYYYHEGTKNPTNGVWIQDTDRYCHDINAWDGKYTANGIAVVTDKCRFVVALQLTVGNELDMWSPEDKTATTMVLVPDVCTVTSVDAAKVDFNGATNTTNIVYAHGTYEWYAANTCNKYVFPRGNRGYLGSGGQFMALADNFDKVNEALAICGKPKISTYGSIWTSTQYDRSYAWYFYPYSKKLIEGYKGEYYKILPFGSL